MVETFETTRVFKQDQTPQFVNYGVNGTPNGLYYAGCRESCQKMIRENRECVTIHPFVSFGGENTNVSSHMAQKKQWTKYLIYSSL